MDDLKSNDNTVICNKIISSEWEKILKSEAKAESNEGRIEYQYYLTADSVLLTVSIMNQLLEHYTGCTETRAEESCPGIRLRYETEGSALLLEFVRMVGESCEVMRYKVPFYSEVCVQVPDDGNEHKHPDSIYIEWEGVDDKGEGNLSINNEYFAFGNLCEFHSVKYKL